jgi:hypothetical protein
MKDRDIEVLVLSKAEIESLVDEKDAAEAALEAFRALGGKRSETGAFGTEDNRGQHHQHHAGLFHIEKYLRYETGFGYV